MTLTWQTFEDKNELDQALATRVAQALAEAIVQRGRAVLVVSGGRTPQGFFQAVRQQDLDWSRVTVTLADERWVPADHADSNERLVREHLLQDHAAAAGFVSLYAPGLSATEGQAEIEARLTRLPDPLDVVILGMGDDGHTASLFPQAPELADALQTTTHCIATTPVTAPHMRMSLSLKTLAKAHNLIVHITGGGKRSLLQTQMLATLPRQDWLPIRTVLDSALNSPVVFWSE